LSQPIWLNFNIKRNGNFLLFKNIAIMVSLLLMILFLKINSHFKYMISTNFLEYYGIVGAVPKWWKNLISEYRRLHDITNDIVDRLKSDKVTKQWAQELGIQIDNWGYICSSSFRTTRNTKPQNFQFKLSHIITATNSFLFKCGLKETELYTFCTETEESLLHLFWECTYTKKMLVFISKYSIWGITNTLDPDIIMSFDVPFVRLFGVR
jgi:hypothetical protein